MYEVKYISTSLTTKGSVFVLRQISRFTCSDVPVIQCQLTALRLGNLSLWVKYQVHIITLHLKNAEKKM